MYLRIDTNQLIFRISQQEADLIQQGQSVRDSLWLSPEFELSYQVSQSDSANECAWTQEDNFIQLIVNKQLLANELDSRPSKQGLEIPFASSELTTARLQIDLKKKP